MFTGIIEETGHVQRVQKGAHSLIITVSAKRILDDLKPGDSIAVNGVCLTATGVSNDGFAADVMHETIKRTALPELGQGSRVNLERAMPTDGRFGGHIVLGHIDGIGVIQRITADDNAHIFAIRANEQILRYVVEKGSVALDGVSLTIVDVSGDLFRVSVIPHTAKTTTFSLKRVGDRLNVETDIIGKYVEKLLGDQVPARGLTKEMLADF